MHDALVRLQRKGQLVIPRSLREQAGVSEGTLLKMSIVEGGQFLLTPQVTIDRAVVTRKKDPKEAFREFSKIVAELRQEAQDKGLHTMPAKEINRAVASARRDLAKGSRRRAK
jgi:bifunctional DNA-binding transcriptional regulator/antitoxin component of YhaV-PrlF toxin-antitoxin module